MAQLDKAFQVKPASRDLVRNLSRSDVCRLIPLTEDIRYSWWLGDNNNNRKPPMAEKDYIAMWYHARKPYGINDTIYWGWYDPDTNSIDWQTWQHADADGMAGFANILRPMGYPCKRTRRSCSSAPMPSLSRYKLRPSQWQQPAPALTLPRR